MEKSAMVEGSKVELNHFHFGKVNGTLRFPDRTDIETFEPEWVGKECMEEVDVENLVEVVLPEGSSFESLWGFAHQIKMR